MIPFVDGLMAIMYSATSLDLGQNLVIFAATLNPEKPTGVKPEVFLRCERLGHF